MPSLLRIATRKSPLALWQAHYVRETLLRIHPHLQVELVEMVTQGDKILDSPLAQIGGKGLFVKELETGLLQNQADIAVHSMKDVPIELPTGLYLSATVARAEPFDAFVSNHYATWQALPHGAIVGTSSLRRQSQLLALRPDLQIRTLRGNVGTRLNKLDAGEYDAIILAAIGLQRLGLAERIRQRFTPAEMLPAIGQGAIGIESRVGDTAIDELLAPLHHLETYHCLQAERAINQHLSGSCQTPIAGFAQQTGDTLHLQGLVAATHGGKILRAAASGEVKTAQAIGEQVAKALLAQGAGELLAVNVTL